MKKELRFLLCLPAFGFAAGCAAVAVPVTVDLPGMPNPEKALQESVRHVDAEMAEIGKITPQEAPRPLPQIVPGELEKVVSFAWEGPLDGAVEKLARGIGYTVSIKAPSGARALEISIDTGPRRVVEVFEAIGAAVGDQATVELDPLHHRVGVVHHV